MDFVTKITLRGKWIKKSGKCLLPYGARARSKEKQADGLFKAQSDQSVLSH